MAIHSSHHELISVVFFLPLLCTICKGAIEGFISLCWLARLSDILGIAHACKIYLANLTQDHTQACVNGGVPIKQKASRSSTVYARTMIPNKRAGRSKTTRQLIYLAAHKRSRAMCDQVINITIRALWFVDLSLECTQDGTRGLQGAHLSCIVTAFSFTMSKYCPNLH